MAIKAYEYYKDLPPWAKGIVVVGGLTVTYIAVSQILAKFKRAKELQKAQLEISAATRGINQLASKGIRPSLSENTLQSYASGIIDAVSGCGTSEEKIYNIFKSLKNEADLLRLIEIFGLRKKERCLFSDDPRDSFWSNQTPPLSLSAHLHLDMSSYNIAKINEILASKGINFKF